MTVCEHLGCGRRPGADTEAQQWKQEDGPAAAAVPSHTAALPPLPPPPIVAACRCGQTRVEARTRLLMLRICAAVTCFFGTIQVDL